MPAPTIASSGVKRSASTGQGGWEGTGPFTLSLTAAPPAGLGTIIPGALLAVLAMADGNPTLTSPTAGWTKVGQANATGTDATCSALFLKVADGTETQFQVQSSLSEGLGAVFVQLDGWSAYNAPSSGAAGSDDTVDPPSVSHPGSGPALYLMFASWDRERGLDTENIVTRDGFTRRQLTIMNTAGGFFGGCSGGLWSKSDQAASLNPADDALNLNASGGTQYKWTSWMVALSAPATSRAWATVIT